MQPEVAQKIAAHQRGPATFLNWVAARERKPLLHTAEYPLYTDAQIIGEATYGPYTFLNTIGMPAGNVRAALVLRYDWHWIFPHPDWSRTDAERYHGGSPADEVAGLASLCLGARFKAGDSTRVFRPGDDPKGRPTALLSRPIPLLVLSNFYGRVLPRVAEGQRSLELLAPLAMLPDLDELAALTLIRCARIYQDALWIAESQPQLAWLLLVSALETAAVYWRVRNDEAAVRLRWEHAEPMEICLHWNLHCPLALQTRLRMRLA